MTNQNMKIRGIIDTEPSVKQTKGNEFYCIASVRTFETMDAENGQKFKSQPEWHTIKVWREAEAKDFAQKFKKGMCIEAEGPLQTSSYTDAKGVKRNVYALVPEGEVREVSRNQPMVNSYTIEGRLGGDPKIGTGASGRAFAVMSVAVNEEGANGNKRTQWVNVMTSSPALVEYAQAMKKGNDVKLEGMLKSNEYVSRDNGRVQSFTLTPNSIELISKEKDVKGNGIATGPVGAAEVGTSMPREVPDNSKGLTAKSSPEEKSPDSPVPF